MGVSLASGEAGGTGAGVAGGIVGTGGAGVAVSAPSSASREMEVTSDADPFGGRVAGG